MISFTHEGYEFEGRQTEAKNIVWLAGNPNISWSYPRSFSFQEVADGLLINYELPVQTSLAVFTAGNEYSTPKQTKLNQKKEGHMTLVKGQLIDQENVSRPTKSGIRIISEMSTLGIMWFVLSKHSSGLKTLAILSMGSYIVYDKVVRNFI